MISHSAMRRWCAHTGPGCLRGELRTTAWVTAALALQAIPYLVMLRQSPAHLDDLYISLRYARNLAGGHGLVFNVGERVEGYTCFLWVVILAALSHVVDLKTGATVLSAALGIAVLPVAYLLARSAGASRPWALVAPAVVALMPGYAYWASSGMETLAVTFLLAVALWVYLRRPASRAVAVLLALAIMTRPDAMVVAGVIGAERFLAWRAGRRFWLWAASFLVIFLPYYLWRYAYYGYALPNTFYAKVGGGWEQGVRGWHYLGDFLIRGGGLALLPLAAIGLWRQKTRTLLTLAAAVLTFCAYVVLVGGDYFCLHRFFIPVVPIYAVLGAVGLERLRRCRAAFGHQLAAAAVAVLVLIGFALSVRSGYAAGKFFSGLDASVLRVFAEEAAFVRDHADPGDSVATVAIGLIGYFTDLHVIDMVGLTDVHIAHQPVRGFGGGLAGHERYDTEYVLDQKPRYIVISGPPGVAWTPISAVTDMWKNPRFLSEYEWVELPYAAGVFTRKDNRD